MRDGGHRRACLYRSCADGRKRRLNFWPKLDASRTPTAGVAANGKPTSPRRSPSRRISVEPTSRRHSCSLMIRVLRLRGRPHGGDQLHHQKALRQRLLCNPGDERREVRMSGAARGNKARAPLAWQRLHRMEGHEVTLLPVPSGAQILPDLIARTRRSRMVYTAPASTPRIGRAPLWRFGPKCSRLAKKASFTKFRVSRAASAVN